MTSDKQPANLHHPVLRAAFEQLAPELASFAERHSLLIERYPRGFPMWTFMFQHPRGGAASVQFNIGLASDSGAAEGSLLPHWWLDLGPENRRLTAEFPTIPVPSLRAADVREALEHTLEHLLALEESALTRELWMRRTYGLPDLPHPT